MSRYLHKRTVQQQQQQQRVQGGVGGRSVQGKKVQGVQEYGVCKRVHTQANAQVHSTFLQNGEQSGSTHLQAPCLSPLVGHRLHSAVGGQR